MKITKRKTMLFLLIFTLFAFPGLLAIISRLDSMDRRAIEGQFIEQAAEGVIVMNLSVVCLPLWVALFIGQELSNGHANRMVFTTSRVAYFLSKIVYCIILSLFFTLLSSSTLWICVKASIFESLSPDFKFTIFFILQTLLINLLYSLTIMCLTLTLRNTVISVVMAYFLPQLEAIAFVLFNRLMNINLFWLPFRLLNSLHTDSVRPQEIRYVNPLITSPTTIIAPIAMVLVVCYLSYRWFLIRDLKPLSD